MASNVVDTIAYLGHFLKTTPDRALAAQVAHDVRSPLSLIQVLEKANLTDAEKLEMVAQAARRLDAIAEETLNARRVRAESDVCEARECIDALLSVRRVLSDENISFVAEGPRAYLNLGPSLFERVISVLLDNAEEAVGNRGWIKCVVSLEASATAIAVMDSGQGFSPELLTQPLGLSTKLGGNGIGLAFVERTMRSVGGTLTRGRGPGGLVELRFPSPRTGTALAL